MNVKIISSPYGEIPPGTIGQVIKPYGSGWCIRVTRTFTTPGATPIAEQRTRDLWFEPDEINFIPEEQPTIETSSHVRPD